jgi:hypothetical protein
MKKTMQQKIVAALALVMVLLMVLPMIVNIFVY